ncbi:hypothetical protein PROSTU_00328 [Providencia stuartii ATCC 25827]|uniref:Uncharacterized protein n=1 Tax=Providencia stuartii ATCC 25827 TaxID=471874 RepID=A0AA86YRN7_PROST|nr:hypothetical protein PROSTU_00328 [Providencia stuartii ATCC 25827]
MEIWLLLMLKLVLFRKHMKIITVSRDMNMRVTKEPVCGYCRNGR